MRDSQLSMRDAHPVGSLADTTPRTFGSFPADPVSCDRDGRVAASCNAYAAYSMHV